MKKAILTSVCAAVLSAGCASTDLLSPQQPDPLGGTTLTMVGQNTKPDLRQMPLKGKINFGYKIYGDPGAAPSQVFDDGRHIYLQFKQDEAPPIPMTRDGKLLEYEVMQGGLVKTPKVDTMTLRLGPRVAFVDRGELEIISLSGSPGPLSSMSVAKSTMTPAPGQFRVEPPASAARAPVVADSAIAPSALQPATPSAQTAASRYAFDPFDEGAAKRVIAGAGLTPGAWRLCHAPTVRDFAAARAVQSMLEAEQKGVRVMLSDACAKPGEAILERM